MKRVTSLWVLLFVLLLEGMLPAQAARQPVFIYLYARMGDHVNIELTEDRIRRILPMLERYRKAHPDAHVSATILFSGAVSQALAERNARTGIKDVVLDYARRGVIELGYDGTDEPTYQRRPVPVFAGAKSPADRWLARGEAAEKFLTEGRDPLTGVPQPGATGGLKKMQEVFGEAACITGVTEDLGGDSEVVQHLGRYNNKAIMFGIPDPNPARSIPGYRGSAAEFGKEMSPIPDSSPELYWQDNVLRSSETSDSAIRVVYGYEGLDALKTVLSKVERSKVRIVHVELANERIYLQAPYAVSALSSPMKLAYDHPDQAKLPADALRSVDDMDAAYAKEDAIIKWLVDDFAPANPGARFVSSTDLQNMTPPGTGYSLSLDGLRAALPDLLRIWEDNTIPPNYLLAEGRYLSLADMFQVMTDALAQLNRAGKLPQSVRVTKVFGPVEMPDDHGPTTGETTVASVARVCAGLTDRLHDYTWSPIPKNAIPSRVTIDGMNLTAAQFLRLMTEALATPSLETRLKVRMTYMFTTSAYAHPKTRLESDQGGTWTFKPAPLNIAPVVQSSN